MNYPSPKRNMVPKAVLMRSGLVSLTTAIPVNTAQPKTTVNGARPMINVFNKAHSTVRRPINNKTTSKNSNFNQKVNTARPKAVLNAVKGNQVNAVKASACWVWRPEENILDHGNPQQDLQEKGVIDSGCPRHMTRNMSYLTDFEEIDGGYVAFGGNPKRGIITSRGTIKTGKLDFENAYFEMILKSKRAKTSQNRQETEETSTREKFEKSYQSRISPTREKKVNEDQIEVKGLILTSFQSSRAHLDVLKSKDQRCQS
ncbi:hypothetical protein Tco_1084716 [Tanacetum coccineum]